MKRMSLNLFGLLFVFLMATACLDLEPNSSVNPVGDPHTVTVTATEFESDVPIVDELVMFRVIGGPNAGRESVPFSGECIPDSCRTDQNGQASWTYTSEDTGLDSITAFIEASIDDEFIEFIPSDTVTKRWESKTRPIPTLSEWGLISMAGVMGVVAFIVLRKRKLEA